MRVETYKCDGCGQLRGQQSKNWFRVSAGPGGLEIGPWSSVPPAAGAVDLCSDSCVIRAVQQWLTGQAQRSRTEVARGPSAIAMIR
jgi:hypothetical protein